MSTTEIPASMVMQLRQETGAGMMDCKRALVETEGDLDAARKLLRERGMAAAEKRQVRETSEGLVVHRLTDERGTLVAVGCETEPVSNNDEFRAFATRVLDLVEEKGPDAVDEAKGEQQDLIAKLGENVVVRGAARFDKESDDEILAAYVHPPRNQIGVLVKLRGGTAELARQLAMHISFAAPRWQTRGDVPEDHVQAERDVYAKLPEVAAKPEEARPKIVEGMLNKRFFAASPSGVLDEQAWIHDDKKKVGRVLQEAGAEVVGFVRYSVSGD